MNVIAADIGGTKTLLVVAEIIDGNYKILVEKKYASKDYESFNQIVTDFLNFSTVHLTKIPARACFAVAGPILNTDSGPQATVTNLPWTLNSKHISSTFNISSVALINDFQAVGIGIDSLRGDDLCVLQKGVTRPKAPRAILGAGTGLGIAQMFWEGAYYKVIASEGGHADLAPTDPLQLELLQYLWKKYDHASYEHTLSGPGLVNIYSFLCEKNQCHAQLRDVLNHDDPAAYISMSTHKDHIANDALDIFIKIYGAQAGNLALLNIPYGGVYIAGGIAPKIAKEFISRNFIKAFLNKGRMSKLLINIPVAIVLNPKIGLIGAILSAGRL